MPRNTHGGRRENAGVKPSPSTRKIPLAIRLDRQIAAYLASVENKTETIEDALRASDGFRDWLGRQF